MRYDAIVIGSGQAGNPLTYSLAESGLKIIPADQLTEAAQRVVAAAA